VVSVIELLVVIQYNVLVVRSGYKKCSGKKGSMSKVTVIFMQRLLESSSSTGCSSIYTGTSANLELLDKFCYLGDMLSVDGDVDAAVEARI